MYPYPNYQPILVGDDALPDLQVMQALRQLRVRILRHDDFFQWSLKLSKNPVLAYFISSTWKPFFNNWQQIDQDLVFESRPEVMQGLAHYLDCTPCACLQQQGV